MKGEHMHPVASAAAGRRGSDPIGKLFALAGAVLGML
jgi:hypothetical protein